MGGDDAGFGDGADTRHVGLVGDGFRPDVEFTVFVEYHDGELERLADFHLWHGGGDGDRFGLAHGSGGKVDHGWGSGGVG